MPENNNKDPIENLFRKKAEEYDISYREEDWLKLEKQLDQQEKQRAAQNKRWLTAAALLFLFSLLGYAVYQNYQGINRINEQLSDQESIETQANENGEELEDLSAGEKDAEEKQNANRTEPKSGLAGKDDEITEEKSQPAIAAEERAGKAGSESDPDSDEPRTSDITIPPVFADEFSCASCRLSDLGESQNEPTTTGMLRSAGTPLPILAAQEESARPGFSEKQPAMQQSGSASRAFIGLAAGPDLSTVGALSDFDQPGYNVGVLFEYRLRSDFSIRTGLMRASVNYVADGSEYHPPSGFWSYDTMPDRTTAQCIILDIPVSLKYEFWHFGRSGFYATAGFNTYIMLNEDYRFDYGYESSSDSQVQQWSGKTGTRHWMSNASISVGYAFDLSPQLSIQIEPFLKLPVREVGWGNVKLYSTGSFISLNYKLY